MSKERKTLKVLSLVILALALVSLAVGVYLLVRREGSIMESLVGVIVCATLCVFGFVVGLAANRCANTPSKGKSVLPYVAALLVSAAGCAAGFGLGVPRAHISAAVLSCALALFTLGSLVYNRKVYEASLK